MKLCLLLFQSRDMGLVTYYREGLHNGRRGSEVLPQHKEKDLAMLIGAGTTSVAVVLTQSLKFYPY